MREKLNALNDAELAKVYEKTIGYNPFEDGVTRSEVIQILVEYSEFDELKF